MEMMLRYLKLNLENNFMHYDFENCGSEYVYVFLHGWGLDSSSFDKIISCINNTSYIKIDLFGFGKSDNPSDYFDTYEYAYQVFLLLKSLSINNIVLVGHSFGGRLAVLLSSIFRINIVKCFLCASAGLNRFSLKKLIKVRMYKFVKWLCGNGVISCDVLKRFGSDDYKNSSYLLRGVLTRVVVQDLGFCLCNMACNTTLMWDKKDKATPYWICKKLNKSISNSNIYILKNGEHFAIFKNVYKVAKIIANI